MADTTEKPGGFLDARKAKAVFVLGVGLYLLMSFWWQAPIYKILALDSEGDQLSMMKTRKLDEPRAPHQPGEVPKDKVADKGELGTKYDKLKKDYDDKKKDYDKKCEQYTHDEWVWDNEKQPGYDEDLRELGKDMKWAQATRNNWAYWAFVGRFIATILMLVGLAFTALNGNEWERAGAIVVIGLVLVGTSGVLGGVNPMALGK